MMKSRDGLIRLKRFRVEERARQVAQIEAMIAEFDRKASDLDGQITAEQERSGIRDVEHFAYPTFAKAAAQRRDNLLKSASELKEQLASAMTEFDAAKEELDKMEALAERDAGERGESQTLARAATGGR